MTQQALAHARRAHDTVRLFPALDGDELQARAQTLSQQFAQLAEQHDREASPPAAQIQSLFDAGLLRATVARRDGGHGMALGQARRIVQTLAQGDPSVALMLAMHYSQHAGIARSQRQGAQANRVWQPALAERLVAQVLREPALINTLQVEPEMGSPSHGGLPLSLATRDGDGWYLNGHKLYCTGSHLLAWLNVLAVTDEPQPRVGFFLVPRQTPGVEIVPTWRPLGMRATASHDVVLTDVRIPLENATGLYDASQGLRADADDFAWYLSLVGAVYAGVAVAARDWLVDFLQRRKPSPLGGQSLASLPTVQESLGRMDLWIETSEALLAQHAVAYDSQQPHRQLGLAARYAAVEHAAQVTALALEMAGNHGISGSHALERHFRNAQCGKIHGPTPALIRGIKGRELLRASAIA